MTVTSLAVGKHVLCIWFDVIDWPSLWFIRSCRWPEWATRPDYSSSACWTSSFSCYASSWQILKCLETLQWKHLKHISTVILSHLFGMLILFLMFLLSQFPLTGGGSSSTGWAVSCSVKDKLVGSNFSTATHLWWSPRSSLKRHWFLWMTLL